MQYNRPKPAYSVSASARDDPLVREMYDDENIVVCETMGDASTAEPRYIVPPQQSPDIFVDRFGSDAMFQGPQSTSSRVTFQEPYGGGETGSLEVEPAFADRQKFRKVPAGGASRSRPPEVLERLTVNYVQPFKEAPEGEIPHVSESDIAEQAQGMRIEGLASIGVILMQANCTEPVVAGLTPKGREMSDVSKYVCPGDRVLQVNGQEVDSSTPVADVEKLLVGATGTPASVRLLRPFPLSDEFARQEFRNRKPENEECTDGVMYYINAVRWCPYLGRCNKWSEEDKRAILFRTEYKKPPSPNNADAEQMWGDATAIRAPDKPSTRDGKVYHPGRGFAFPTDTGGWELPSTRTAQTQRLRGAAVAEMRGQHGSGRTTDDVEAIEAQQQAIANRYAAMEAEKLTSFPGLQHSVASLVSAHVEDLQAHKLRPRVGMGAIDLRQELDRLEQRNAVMVHTCLSLYKQLTSGKVDGSQKVVEELEQQMLEERGALRRKYKDGVLLLEQKLKESNDTIKWMTRDASEQRTAFDVETARLRKERQAMELRLQAQIDVLTKKLEQDSEFSALRREVDSVLVLQTNRAVDYKTREEGDKALENLKELLRRSKSARLEQGAGAGTEDEKDRMALGGLIAEVEVLSLTNAQLVIDLYRVRQEKDHFHNLSEGHERMQRERDAALERQQVLLKQLDALTNQVRLLQGKLETRDKTRAELEKEFARKQEMLEAALRRREDDFREGCERDFRGKEQALLDQIGEKERGMVDLRDALRAEILLREQHTTDGAEDKTQQRLEKESLMSELSASKNEVHLAHRSIRDLETQVALDAEEYRRGLAALQADLEMSSDTLRTALAEAKGQLATAKERLRRADLQLAEKNAILEKSAKQLVELERQLQDTNNKFLMQSMETGCLACRRANLKTQTASGSPDKPHAVTQATK